MKKHLQGQDWKLDEVLVVGNEQLKRKITISQSTSNLRLLGLNNILFVPSEAC